MERNFLKEINQIDNDAKNFIVKKMKEFSIDVLELTTPKPLVYNYDFGANETMIAQIRIGVHSIDDVVFVTTDENYETFIHSDEVVCGTMAYFALVVNEEIDGFYQRMNEQAKLVQKQPTYSKRFFFLPDKFNPRDLSDMDFASKAFMFGNVMSMEQYADAFNRFQLDNIHPDKGDIRVIEYSDTIIEMCLHCECEVVLETNFVMQTCPICGKKIAPCGLCGGNCVNNCPLGAN